MLTVLLVLAVAALAPGLGAQAAPPVSAYPSPGTATASRATQLSFRGMAAARLGTIRVRGSRSGSVSGRVRAHSDGKGASWIPARRFKPAERVRVTTRLRIRGARAGDFSFHVARAPERVTIQNRYLDPVDPGRLFAFRSRPDLQPAKVTVTPGAKPTAPGAVFITPKSKKDLKQAGPMIVDDAGQPYWFKPLPGITAATDFRAQTYRGKPVLTWWEGFSNLGTGNGEGVILDRRYRETARVQAGNGYFMDPHEFELTDRGTALIGSLAPTARNLKKLGGRRRGVVLDTVVQEIDVATGLVLFEWHSLDDVALRESYVPAPKDKKPWDYFHINSIEEVRGGDLLVSGRNTWSAVKIGRPGAKVAWKLGGKRSDFRIEKGAGFAWQHDVRQRPSGVITLFDNGAFPPVHKESRGLGFRLRGKRAMKVRDYRHKPKLLTSSQGNVQVLRNGNVLIGWGALPVVSEFSSAGKLLFELTLPKPLNPGPPPKTLDDLLKAPKPTQSYRAFRQRWSGLPAEPPAIVASTNSKRTKVYMSWNGATNVARWRVLAGGSPESLRPVARVRNEGFETAVTLKGSPAYVAVQPRDRRGRAFAPSRVIRPRRER